MLVMEAEIRGQNAPWVQKEKENNVLKSKIAVTYQNYLENIVSLVQNSKFIAHIEVVEIKKPMRS